MHDQQLPIAPRLPVLSRVIPRLQQIRSQHMWRVADPLQNWLAAIQEGNTFTLLDDELSPRRQIRILEPMPPQFERALYLDASASTMVIPHTAGVRVYQLPRDNGTASLIWGESDDLWGDGRSLPHVCVVRPTACAFDRQSRLWWMRGTEAEGEGQSIVVSDVHSGRTLVKAVVNQAWCYWQVLLHPRVDAALLTGESRQEWGMASGVWLAQPKFGANASMTGG